MTTEAHQKGADRERNPFHDSLVSKAKIKCRSECTKEISNIQEIVWFIELEFFNLAAEWPLEDSTLSTANRTIDVAFIVDFGDQRKTTLPLPICFLHESTRHSCESNQPFLLPQE